MTPQFLPTKSDVPAPANDAQMEEYIHVLKSDLSAAMEGHALGVGLIAVTSTLGKLISEIDIAERKRILRDIVTALEIHTQVKL